MQKKMIAIISILILLMTTIGATIVSAQLVNKNEHHGFFSSIFSRRNGPTLDELITMHSDLKETKQDLHHLLESYGIKLPKLTIEQKQEIFRTVRDLRKNGIPREEIRDEIVDILIGFGVNLPGFSAEQRGEIRDTIKDHLENEYGFVFIQLTPEQQSYMKQTLMQLKRQGEEREEIKVELISLYEGYGGTIPELTDTEKEEIYDWIVTMLETDYNLNFPDLTVEQRQEIKEKKQETRDLYNDLRHQLRQANWLTRFRFVRYVRYDRAE